MARSRRWQLARAASNCGAIATLSSFLGSVTLRGGFGPIPSINELGGLIMTTGNVTLTEQTITITDVFATNDVRTLVANHLGVSVDRVTDEAHFTNDLGADWLDRLELMIEQITELERQRDAVLDEERPDKAAEMIQQLASLRGIGVQSS